MSKGVVYTTNNILKDYVLRRLDHNLSEEIIKELVTDNFKLKDFISSVEEKFFKVKLGSGTKLICICSFEYNADSFSESNTSIKEIFIGNSCEFRERKILINSKRVPLSYIFYNSDVEEITEFEYEEVLVNIEAILNYE